MHTHPLWRPYETPSMEEINAARLEVGAPASVPVEVVAPDPDWPKWYESVSDRIRGALGERALAIEHVGSTAVLGLWAKPLIDVDLTVADSADEDAWLPDLVAAGFVLRVREPEWEEHRLVRGTDPDSNVHIFSLGAQESQRVRMFRDWLRTHPEDRDACSTTTRRHGSSTTSTRRSSRPIPSMSTIHTHARTSVGDRRSERRPICATPCLCCTF
ncbi:MAG: GrpB family protein [Nocardioides sp.]|uniref:GrpB family protein n=1 Tax=Nocardioides sp. TaxID=35761 RepID=UPI0039E6BFD4